MTISPIGLIAELDREARLLYQASDVHELPSSVIFTSISESLHTTQIRIAGDIYHLKLVSVSDSHDQQITGAFIDAADIRRYLDILRTPELSEESFFAHDTTRNNIASCSIGITDSDTLIHLRHSVFHAVNAPSRRVCGLLLTDSTYFLNRIMHLHTTLTIYVRLQAGEPNFDP